MKKHSSRPPPPSVRDRRGIGIFIPVAAFAQLEAVCAKYGKTKSALIIDGIVNTLALLGEYEAARSFEESAHRPSDLKKIRQLNASAAEQFIAMFEHDELAFPSGQPADVAREAHVARN